MAALFTLALTSADDELPALNDSARSVLLIAIVVALGFHLFVVIAQDPHFFISGGCDYHMRNLFDSPLDQRPCVIRG